MKTSSFSFAAALLLGLAACQTTKPAPPPPPAAQSLSMRPKSDIRKLRTTLGGKGMKDVLRVLGQPTRAYTLDEREFWVYEDAARDSVTDRPVHWVEIVFSKRIVEDVNFSL